MLNRTEFHIRSHVNTVIILVYFFISHECTYFYDCGVCSLFGSLVLFTWHHRRVKLKWLCALSIFYNLGFRTLHFLPRYRNHGFASNTLCENDAQFILCSRQVIGSGVTKRNYLSANDVTRSKRCINLDLVSLRCPHILNSANDRPPSVKCATISPSIALNHVPDDALEILSTWRAVYDIDADASESWIYFGDFSSDLKVNQAKWVIDWCVLAEQKVLIWNPTYYASNRRHSWLLLFSDYSNSLKLKKKKKEGSACC